MLVNSGLAGFLRARLSDRGTGFSIGCLGAIAEFHDSGADVMPADADGGVTAVGELGAIRMLPDTAMSALAYETLGASDSAWQCAVAICATGATLLTRGQPGLTELGHDDDAIQVAERGALLFDIGLGIPNMRFCVRTRDGALIRELRRHLGRTVTGEVHPIFAHIIDASPHRIAISAIGRIEVYQRIDRHETPVGPHTHLLPKLLKRRRTHSANIPIPASSTPVLTVHPQSPIFDNLGRRTAFIADAFEAFERMLDEYGLPHYVHEKERLRDAVRDGVEPAVYALPASRLGRLAMRVTLRQLRVHPPAATNISRWLDQFKA